MPFQRRAAPADWSAESWDTTGQTKQKGEPLLVHRLCVHKGASPVGVRHPLLGPHSAPGLPLEFVRGRALVVKESEISALKGVGA